jgi:hypothetical protein
MIRKTGAGQINNLSELDWSLPKKERKSTANHFLSLIEKRHTLLV